MGQGEVSGCVGRSLKEEKDALNKGSKTMWGVGGGVSEIESKLSFLPTAPTKATRDIYLIHSFLGVCLSYP